MVTPTLAEQSALQRFFRAAQYAVVGASADRGKFGNRVMRWYQAHQLTVTPVNPKTRNIEGVATVSDLEHVIRNASNPVEAETSVSIVAPPHISLEVLKNYANYKEILGFWLQPGAADGAVVQWLKNQPENVQEKIIWSGSCILVDGEKHGRHSGRL